MSTKRRTLGVHSQPRPLGPNGEKLCFNCHGPLPKGRTYNCSSKCSEEWRGKTSPSHMRYLVRQRDHGICANCGLDTIALRKEFDSISDAHGNSHPWSNPTARFEFLKKHNIPSGRTGDFWDADHIIPVIEGGGECDLSNFRTLCIPCHQKVTKEMHERLAQKRRDAKTNAARELLSKPLQFGNMEQKKAARLLAKLNRERVAEQDDRC